MSDEQNRQAARTAWQRTCLHIEGLAVASTIAGFGTLGVYERLSTEARLSDFRSAGYAGVGLRLLDHLGWLDRGQYYSGRPTLSAMGRAACVTWPFYRDAVVGTVGEADARRPAGYGDGFCLAPLLLRLHDTLPGSARKAGAAIGDALVGHERALMAARGLVAAASGRLTPEGSYAVAFALQYRHVLSYAPLLARVPALLAGTDVFVPDPIDHEETHLDRAADIRFSGDVYAASCAPGVTAMAERIAAARPFRHLIDIGAGDGTMLVALHRVLAPLLPGLTAVAVEPSDVARAHLSRHLEAAGIAHLVLDGDVGDPPGVRASLRARGVALDESLVTMKSVLHDRALRIPCPTGPLGAGMPAGQSACRFVGPGGQPASAAWVEADLVSCLAAWRRVLGPAGMLLVEAHTAASTIAPPERALLVALDATHGYSHQYLLEAEVHLDCCVAAGFDVTWAPINEQLGFVALSAAWLSEPHDSPAKLRRA